MTAAMKATLVCIPACPVGAWGSSTRLPAEASDIVFEEGPRAGVVGSSRKQWGQGMASGVVYSCLTSECGSTLVVVFGISVKENRAGCPPDEAGLAKGWARSGLDVSLVSSK